MLSEDGVASIRVDFRRSYVLVRPQPLAEQGRYFDVRRVALALAQDQGLVLACAVEERSRGVDATAPRERDQRTPTDGRYFGGGSSSSMASASLKSSMSDRSMSVGT